VRSVVFITKKLITTDRFVKSRQGLDSKRRLDSHLESNLCRLLAFLAPKTGAFGARNALAWRIVQRL
jgi:hypothetical protein